MKYIKNIYNSGLFCYIYNMKKKSYSTSIVNDTKYYLMSVPIKTINIIEFVDAVYKISEEINRPLLDEYTLYHFIEFCNEGYTESRVKNAPNVQDDDQMILFAYDDEFKSPVGMAISFNKKFYALGYSKGKKSESELHILFKNKNI